MATQGGTVPEYTELEVVLADGAALAAGQSSELASVPLDAGCATTGQCTWSFTGVDVSGATGGLVAMIRDTRSEPLWATTWTSQGTAADLAAAVSAGSMTTGVTFALSNSAIETIIAPLTGVSAADLAERGWIFGLVYDGLSEDGSGTPVAGATAAAAGADLAITYPTATFSGTAAATGGQGVFLAVPKAAGGTASVTFTITPAGASDATWDATYAAVLQPGVVTFHRLYAK